MAELLQKFEEPISDSEGTTYDVFLYGRSRPGDTWQGWLVFERQSDGRRFTTGIETTQSDARAVMYWATGLGQAYFEGALRRALQHGRPRPRAVALPRPVVTRGADAATRAESIATIQDGILSVFKTTDRTHLLTPDLLEALPYAHADTVRAIEDLEKRRRAIVRHTEEGNDWLFLTSEGMKLADLEERPHEEEHAG